MTSSLVGILVCAGTHNVKVGVASCVSWVFVEMPVLSSVAFPGTWRSWVMTWIWSRYLRWCKGSKNISACHFPLLCRQKIRLPKPPKQGPWRASRLRVNVSFISDAQRGNRTCYHSLGQVGESHSQMEHWGCQQLLWLWPSAWVFWSTWSPVQKLPAFLIPM